MHDVNKQHAATPEVRRPMMTIKELAEYVGVPVATVYRWNTRRSGPTPIKIGRHVRYHHAEVDRWISELAP